MESFDEFKEKIVEKISKIDYAIMSGEEKARFLINQNLERNSGTLTSTIDLTGEKTLVRNDNIKHMMIQKDLDHDGIYHSFVLSYDDYQFINDYSIVDTKKKRIPYSFSSSGNRNGITPGEMLSELQKKSEEAKEEYFD